MYMSIHVLEYTHRTTDPHNTHTHTQTHTHTHTTHTHTHTHNTHTPIVGGSVVMRNWRRLTSSSACDSCVSISSSVLRYQYKRTNTDAPARAS